LRIVSAGSKLELTSLGFVMVRRCISTLLIIAFLVGQLAAVPHAHAESADHAKRSVPHVHLTAWGNADHGHGHKHHDTADLVESEPSHEPAMGWNALPEHDADAIYLCDATPGMSTKSATGAEQAGVRSANASVAVACVLVQAGTEARCPSQEHSFCRCARYLELRTLRI